MTTYAIVASKKVTVDTAAGPVTLAKGQVMTLVVWDGKTPFDPGDGLSLQEVPDGWGVGADGKLSELPRPETPPEVPPPVYTRRRHIYERATKSECATLAATLEQADDQLAQIFMASDWIDHGNAWFPDLQAAILQAVGQERAAELLAPSTYPEV
jgi:hypothetical protein